MNKAFLFLFSVIASVSISKTSFAAEAYYLGGARSALHCSRIAGSWGYTAYQFGGYYQGVYLVNGCFGIGNTPAPYSENTLFDVITYGDSTSCASDIEFRVDNVSCRVKDSSSLECKTKRKDTDRVKGLIYNVKCVKDIKRG